MVGILLLLRGNLQIQPWGTRNLCFVEGASVFPWRVPSANYLDIATNGGFLVILFLAALFLDEVNAVFVANTLLVVFIALVTLSLVMVLRCLWVYYLKSGKKYEYFLCHHKVGGGAFARLLKMQLREHPRLQREVFLDSDNLEDLSTLFATVAHQVGSLVVLCSAEVLSRPWCVGEMTTAHRHGVDVILILFPNFRWPTEEFVSNYATHVSDIECLFHKASTWRWCGALCRGCATVLKCTFLQSPAPRSSKLSLSSWLCGSVAKKRVHR